MCGIAGLFRYAGDRSVPDEAVGLRMTESLRHRGPDDGGLLVGPSVLLGHRRLSIIDPRPDGHQPMSDADERVWIVFNGEIYNFRELRGELEAKGRRFRTRTDTEVILHAYLEWGDDAFGRLDGMFAFGLWDVREARLVLVRDPIGIKPLFYHDDGRAVRFGSEIKAILVDPAVSRSPDLVALDAFFTFGYMPAPLTGFEGVRQLMPGEMLVADRDGCRVEPCIGLGLSAVADPIAERDAVERLRKKIDDAVRRQTVSDVPLGAFLSGGLDSSAVVRAMRGDGERVHTFSIGFGEPSFDESPVAERVARLLGTEHHGRRVDADAADLLPQIVSHAEEPLADNSMIPFFLLSAFARERVTVALSGDGMDELLAGYDTYKATRLARRYRRLPKALRDRVIAPAVRGVLPPGTAKYGKAMLLRRFVAAAGEPFPRDHASWRRYLSPTQKAELYEERFLDAAAYSDPIGRYAAAIEEAPGGYGDLGRALYGDLRFHLTNDILVKADRMSMAHSLEVRVPLLDLELVRFCFSLPDDLKLRGRNGKYVLRRSLEEALPSDVTGRRKAGFVVPVEAWTRGPLVPMLREFLSAESLAEAGLIRPQAVETMIADHVRGRRDHAYELFALLVWSIWWRVWIDGSLSVRCVERPAAAVKVRRLAA